MNLVLIIIGLALLVRDMWNFMTNQDQRDYKRRWGLKP